MTTPQQPDLPAELANIRHAALMVNHEGTPGETSWHHNNELQQGEILLAWEKLTALTGHQDIALENGFEMPQHLREMPRAPQGALRREEIRQALTELLLAADDINSPQTPDDQLEDHNGSAAQQVLQAQQQLAVLLGQHRMALLNHPEQPLIPFAQLGEEPLLILGVAALHAEEALQDYQQAARNPQNPPAQQHWNDAELNGRLAHRLLWLDLQVPADSPERARTLRNHCRNTQKRLNQAREHTARQLGMEAPEERSTGRVEL